MIDFQYFSALNTCGRGLVVSLLCNRLLVSYSPVSAGVGVNVFFCFNIIINVGFTFGVNLSVS